MKSEWKRTMQIHMDDHALIIIQVNYSRYSYIETNADNGVLHFRKSHLWSKKIENTQKFKDKLKKMLLCGWKNMHGQKETF